MPSGSPYQSEAFVNILSSIVVNDSSTFYSIPAVFPFHYLSISIPYLLCFYSVLTLAFYSLPAVFPFHSYLSIVSHTCCFHSVLILAFLFHTCCVPAVFLFRSYLSISIPYLLCTCCVSIPFLS